MMHFRFFSALIPLFFATFFSACALADEPATAPSPSAGMTFNFTNATKGKFPDDQVYWAIIGLNSKGQMCHVDGQGNLVPLTDQDNSAANHLSKDNVDYANYFNPVSTAGHVAVPKMSAARIFISVGGPMYIRAVGNGYAGANIANPTDPNRDVYFDFIEFTYDDTGFHGNTSQVDQFGIPMTIEAVDSSGTSTKAGITQSRAELFAAFKKDLPPAFGSCDQEPYRIVAPCSADFAADKPNAHYFDSYIDQVWSHMGKIVNGALVITDARGAEIRIAQKPTTQEVLLGNGVLGSLPQVCAAINRHVMEDPTTWNTPAKYYSAEPANFYAKFWHDHSINGKAYGFCYDDVNDQSSLIEARHPTALNVVISWD
jgi:Beta-1,3-glucanase